MVSPGDSAPSFALPAVVDGERQVVDLEEYPGEDIVVLAFYPGDFNPACSEESTGLDALDLFTMQKDVSILAVSGDSVHSHRAFAAEYDLQVPLLADVTGEVATAYGLRVENSEAGYLTRRGVVVLDPNGEVAFTWEAEDPERLPDAETVRSAVDDISSEDTALARYRVGHAHYREGRRAFTSAMHAFEDSEWMLAQSDFSTAHEEFAAALDAFDTAARFSETEAALGTYEDAEDTASALWRATEWLAEAASAFASGEGARGQQLRRDAETPLETARELPDPPDPDAFPFEAEPSTGEGDGGSVPSAGDDPASASLEVDIDAVARDTDEPTGDTETAGHTAEPDTAAAVSTADTASTAEADTASTAEADTASTAEADTASTADADEIDEAELDEITAELEAQTEEARKRNRRDSVVPDRLDHADEADDAGSDDGPGTE